MAGMAGKCDGIQSRRNGTRYKGCAGVVSEELYIEHFQQVPAIYITTSKELELEVREIRIALANTKLDWEKRVNAAKMLRSVVYAGASEFPEFAALLQSVLPSLQLALKDLRSQVVKETCFTIGFLTEQFGTSFEGCAEVLLPSLVALLSNSAKVVTSCAAITLTFLVQYVQSARLIPLITSHFTSKSQAMRRECYKLLSHMLQSWPSATLSRQVAALQEAVKRGIGDADADARCYARSGFIAFMEHFPDVGSTLLRSLDQTKQKLIRNEMTLPTSMTRLCGSRSSSSEPPTTSRSHISAQCTDSECNTDSSPRVKRIDVRGTKPSPRSPRGACSRSPVTPPCSPKDVGVKGTERAVSSVVKRVSSAPPHSRSSDQLNMTDHNREDLFADKYEDVPHVQVNNASDVHHFMTRVRLGLSNQDNWTDMKNALKLLRSLLLAGASAYPEFFTLLHEIEVHILSTVIHRRSDVALEVCVTLSHLSKYIGRGFDRLAESVLPVFLSVVPLTKNIQLTISHFIQNSQTARLVPVITQHITSRNVVLRRACCELMCHMLFEWPTKSLVKSATALQTAIRHAIHDADPCVRYHARQCFLSFSHHFESHAKLLENSLDSSKRRTLQQLLRRVSEDTIVHSWKVENRTNRQNAARCVTPVPDEIPTDAEVSCDAEMAKRKDNGPQSPATVAPSADSTNVSTSQTPRQAFNTSRGEVGQESNSMNTEHKIVTLVAKNIATLVKPTDIRAVITKETDSYVAANENQHEKVESRASTISQIPGSSRADTAVSYDESGITSTSCGSSNVTVHGRGAASFDTSSIALHTVSDIYVKSSVILTDADSETRHRVDGLGVLCLNSDDESCTRARLKERAHKVHKEMIVTRIQQCEFDTERRQASDLVDGGDGAKHVSAGRMATSVRTDIAHNHNAETTSQKEDSLPPSANGGDAYDSTKKPYWSPDKDPKDMCRLLRNINSVYWKEREKGLMCLQTRIRDPVYNISSKELRRITDTFTKMFSDSNEKVLLSLLDTVLPLLKRYAGMLGGWLPVCLAGTLRLAHQMKQPSVQCLTATLSLLRHSVKFTDQFNTILKYIVEMTSPNLQVTTIVLDYMHTLVLEMTPADCQMTGDFELALARIIMWLTEPFDVIVSKKSEEVLKSLHKLKPADFSLALSRLPATFQDDANMRLKPDFRVTPFCYGLFSLSPASIGYIKAMQFGYPGSYTCEDQVDFKETSPVKIQDFTEKSAGVSKPVVASKSALLSEILKEFRLSNTQNKRMLRVSALTKLASFLGQPVVWDIPVNNVLAILLNTISADDDSTLQVLAISILRQFLEQKPADLSRFNASLLRKLLNLHQHSTAEVHKMADKCTKVLITQMDIEKSMRMLCQVIEVAPNSVQSAALGQLTHIIEVHSKESLEPHVYLIVSTLIIACDSSSDEVKKAALVCLATLHWTVGSELLAPLSTMLTNIKTRLLNLHLKQMAAKQMV